MTKEKITGDEFDEIMGIEPKKEEEPTYFLTDKKNEDKDKDEEQDKDKDKGKGKDKEVDKNEDNDKKAKNRE